MNRMKTKIVNLIVLLLMSAPLVSAQSEGEELRLSLAEAQKYAIDNNMAIASVRYDIESSKLALWEAISAGLPQLNGSASLNDNLKLMTTLLPGEFVGQPGTKVPVQFGSKYNSSFGAQASMLLFSGQYIVGIQTATLAQKLTGLNVDKTEQDTKEGVVMSYYLILISEESMKILEGNIAALDETLRSTRTMLAAGMAEATDVDQMVSNVSMMENTKSSMERTLELNYNMLRFQLGVTAGTKLILTESLESIVAEHRCNAS
jgi:outer membrane protein